MISKNKSCKFPKIRLQLLEMYHKDQGIRRDGDFNQIETTNKMVKIDAENQRQLEEILKLIGLPSISNIGLDGAESVWLVAQHSCYNLPFMKLILGLMKQIEESNPDDCYREGIAYLTDNVLFMQGENQLFGTQFWMSPNGKPEPYPIDDFDNIESRRKEYGLRPFRDYLKDITSSTSGIDRSILYFLY